MVIRRQGAETQKSAGTAHKAGGRRTDAPMQAQGLPRRERRIEEARSRRRGSHFPPPRALPPPRFEIAPHVSLLLASFEGLNSPRARKDGALCRRVQLAPGRCLTPSSNACQADSQVIEARSKREGRRCAQLLSRKPRARKCSPSEVRRAHFRWPSHAPSPGQASAQVIEARFKRTPMPRACMRSSRAMKS